ncbi:5'/3'-nucleotidase SurE [Niveispirillum sp.]|uniref:5'/3'-nucleotidase SurE n=1 Tax=Niveispirillum sp. TaxID=1917217 RepID=UPI001B552C34|nr:5'/3'-nucleotidase SurE [Niveispirillum sp.]MBP7335762.1 5'/3'-nucleotidase SurE [Niveispirillum sp.]
MQAPTAPLFQRALLTNDDGVDAPGMAALLEAVTPLAREVWVVAPEHDQSGVSRALSLHGPLRVLERGPHRFAVTGTPSDCVIIGLSHILKDNPPDIVFSGINRGANLGEEVGYSGTVSAALMARMCGVPAYAISQAWRDRNNVRWHTAISGLDAIVRRFGAAPASVLNVNFPDVEPAEIAGVSVTRQAEPGSMVMGVESREDTRGFPYHWLSIRRHPGQGADDTDIGALRRKEISVTPIGFDMTDHAMLKALRG